MKNIQHHTVSISPTSIVLLILIPLGLFFLWTVREIIYSLLIGFILMSALRPGINALIKRKVPRPAAIATIYSVFVLFFVLLISLIIPPILYESVGLIRNLPSILEKVSPQLTSYLNSDLATFIPTITNNVFDVISGVFSNTLFVMTCFFFGLYFIIEDNIFPDTIHHYFDEHKTKKIVAAMKKAEVRMSAWFWGEITLMTVVGVMTYIGLNIIGIKYALPLAVLAGLLEIVPNIGPTLSAIPAVIIGFSASSFTGISTIALYIIVQQLENNLIVPQIMKRAVGINPVLTLVYLLVGSRVGGVLGVLLAVPVVLIIETIATELRQMELPSENT